MGIKIGNLDIASLKLGSADVTAYLGDVLIYSGGTPPQPTSAKWIATYTGGTTDSAACDSSSAITGSEITLTDLESVVIGDCVTSIGASAFTTGAVYNTLSSVTIPVSVTSIGNSAFFASKLVSVEIPNSVTTIGNYAFGGIYNGTGNTSLTTAVIGSGVTSFGSGIFMCQDNIQSVTIYATTPPTVVGGSIFTKSNAYDIPENLVIYVPSESVDAYKAASGWSTYADRIQAIFKWSIVNNGNKVVYTGACNSSSTYSSADTLDYVALVEAGGSDYYDADSIEFGNCVTSIDYNCLTDGNGNDIGYIIQAIIIPSSVTYIADEAFINTPGNEDIVCYATTPPILGGLDAFGSFGGTIYVPDEALSDYQNDSDWSYFDLNLKGLSDRMNYRFKLIVDDQGEYISACDPGQTTVNEYDDFSNANYTYSGTPVEIYVGDCVNAVDSNTFNGSTGLTKVVLGKNIFEIGSCAFCSTNGSFILICLAGTPPTLKGHIFDVPNGGIYVPDDSVDAYKEASIWSVYAQGIFPISDLN